MNFTPTKRIKQDFLIVIVFLQLMVYFTVLFDIPIARQILGFFYFTFLPGFIILKLLKLNELDKLETVLFSVGLSIAFLMIAGLLINEFSFIFGVSQPLSLLPLMVILNNIILIGGILVCLRGDSFKLWSSDSLEVSPFALLFMVLPILSVLGAIYVNVYGNNLILLFMIVAITLLFIIGVISKKLLPPKLYPLALLMIAIALLYHVSLISNYLVPFSSDVTGEYFAFKATANNSFWSSTDLYRGIAWPGYGRLNAMLSVTILPTIYSSLLNMDPVWIFKMMFPLLFSFVPLALYQVWQARFGRKYAFISAFLFMSQATFYTELLALTRQMIAELFFVSLLLVSFNKKLKPANKIICFLIFSFALITSHYALAEIFLFFTFFVLISLILLRRPNRNITACMVVLFFVLMFSWYIYTSNSATFDSFIGFGNYVYSQLGEFSNPASRGEMVLRGLGMEAPPSIWNAISRLFAYITQALIIIGFVGLIIKRKKFFLEREYFLFTSVAVALLAALILVPGLANTLNMTRFYHILLIFLAPLCVLGAEVLANFVSKRKTEATALVLLLLVLVPYFLFQTSFVYEVTGSESWSLPLSKHRMDTLKLYIQFGYTDTSSVFGAQWLSKNVNVDRVQLYSDGYSRGNVLRGYGMVYKAPLEINNVTQVVSGGIVYLSRFNTAEETVVAGDRSWNLSELHFLNDLSKIYSNGGSEIYKNTP